MKDIKDRKKILLSFDLDNTLIDNREGIVNSFNYALKKYNLPALERNKIEKMIGTPLDDMFEFLILIQKSYPPLSANITEKKEFTKQPYCRALEKN
jgi:beta-phosphoglucomutase-like phosphatase (HAD superfamily)